MGVMSCSRLGCDNIMCSTYSQTYGYICSECLDELKSKPFINLTVFMGTPKEDVLLELERELWEQHINKEFRDC